MARTPFHDEVLTPEGLAFEDDVEMVSARTTVGSIGILANHEPLLARLEPSELRLYRSESDIVRFAAAEGYLQMADNRALVLVEEAIDPASLNAGELSERVAAARHAMEAAPEGSEEAARAAADLRRAEAFLAIAGAGSR